MDSSPEATYHTKTFCRRPLGMEFSQKMPIALTRVKGEAADLGIERSWTIKAVGGVSLEGKTFAEAYQLLRAASEMLPLEWLTRTCPCDMDFGDLAVRVGPVPLGEVAAYVGRFGYRAGNPQHWLQDDSAADVQPHLTLGVINGHAEKGNTEMHTWYALQCRISLKGSSATFRWQVERRLLHLRRMLHDPIRTQVAKTYGDVFKGAHFAKRGGPPGTTKRLEGWLGALAAVINKRDVSPALVALTLRFLEAPELIRENGVDLVANAIAGTVAEASSASAENAVGAAHAADASSVTQGESELNAADAAEAPDEEGADVADDDTDDGEDGTELPAEQEEDDHDIPIEDNPKLAGMISNSENLDQRL